MILEEIIGYLSNVFLKAFPVTAYSVERVLSGTMMMVFQGQ